MLSAATTEARQGRWRACAIHKPALRKNTFWVNEAYCPLLAHWRTGEIPTFQPMTSRSVSSMITLLKKCVQPLLMVSALSASTIFAQNGSATAAEGYSPAAIHALPELQCNLYPTGEAPSVGVPVFTDGDGYARFYAVRPSSAYAVTELTLDCKDSAGRPSSYAVDLTAAATFIPHPLALANEPGRGRTALAREPLGYTQADLIRARSGL